MASPHHEDEAKLLSRAYQIEMFQASMDRNIIITMDTGSGKTHVARLRIEAELHRTPTKRIWFLAPTVVLCMQQSDFLSSQLQAYKFRTLLGADNVDKWTSQTTWDAVLRDVDVVVSTPQVLLDALNSAFVSLTGVSLLVFDEAHHCSSDSPTALIMRRHYHSLKTANSPELPHVLGLTASPIISKNPVEMERLEQLLDASCRSPTRSVVEYRNLVHLPQLVAIDCAGSGPVTTKLLALLEDIDQNMKHTDDPYYRELLTRTDLKSVDRLRKYDKRRTPAMEQIHKFAANAKYLNKTLGATAGDDYISSCVKIWHEAVAQHEDWLKFDTRSDASFIDEVLLPLRCATNDYTRPATVEMTSKVAELIKFLAAESADGIRIVIFVTRRTTALALSALLNVIPWKRTGRAFAFLGAASLHGSCLFEVTDINAQYAAFVDFRKGVRDICVATASLEEGIDVQEINTVIRFDPPPTFKSYIQSRGRARKPDSKFVFFLDADDAVKRYSDWNLLEQQMKAQYTDEMRALKERETVEAEYESGDEIYCVESTNAMLDYTSAMQRLNHFCASQRPPGYAVMTMEGTPGVDVRVTTVLPSSLPPMLQTARNKYPRHTERMAKRDAAFQACVMLHKVGLLNDNLVPPHSEKARLQDRRVFANRQSSALPEIDIWHPKSPIPTSTLYIHRLEFTCCHFTLSGVQLILPTMLDHDLEFQLQTNHLGRITVRLHVCGEYVSVDRAADTQISNSLLRKVFGNKSLTSDCLILLPDVPPESLNALTGSLGLKTEIGPYLASEKQSPLLFFSNKYEGVRPYQWIPTVERHSHDEESSTSTVSLRKSRHLQFFLSDILNQAHALTKPTLSVDCHADPVATKYGCSVQLVPSILHIAGAALRAQEARKTILRQILFHDKSLLTQALIAKSSSVLFNYERLEFLGDAVLKYLASLQVFFDMPQYGSNDLTAAVSEIVTNDYLLRSTEQLGLDAYISASRPLRTTWKFPYSTQISSSDSETPEKRMLSSKTLADVIESIVGAAFLQGNTDDSKDENARNALTVLLPKVSWNYSKQRIQDATGTAFQSLKSSSMTKPQQNISEMLGYNFTDAGLVQQALTHSTDLIGVRSYDRLEFLGDAILDRIIKVKIYDTVSYNPARMTLVRHAVVSHALLAFVALGVFIEATDAEVEVEKSCKVFEQSSKIKTYLIQQISTSRTVRSQIVAARSRYEEQRLAITESLEKGIFPWTLLYSLNAPKVCSDIIESLIAATYLDSGGSLAACEQVLSRLNIMQLMHVFAQNVSFELRTPRVQLQERIPQQVSIGVRCDGTEGNEQSYRATLRIKDREPATIVGAICKEEAECRVAEKALSMIDTLMQRSEEISTTESVEGTCG